MKEEFILTGSKAFVEVTIGPHRNPIEVLSSQMFEAVAREASISEIPSFLIFNPSCGQSSANETSF